MLIVEFFVSLFVIAALVIAVFGAPLFTRIAMFFVRSGRNHINAAGKEVDRE